MDKQSSAEPKRKAYSLYTLHTFVSNTAIAADGDVILQTKKKQSFLYGSTILMVSVVIVKLVGAIFKIPLANILHETGMGYFNSAYTIYTTVYALTVTGLSTAVARMVAENAARGRYRDVKRLLSLATRVFMGMGAIGFLVIALSAGSFSASIESENSYWTVLMIAPAILFCCLMASYRGYYEGLSDMIPTAITQVVEVVVKMLAGLSFAGLVMAIASNQYETSGVVFGVAVQTAEEVAAIAIPFAAAGAMCGVSVSTAVGFIYVFIRYKMKGDSITKAMIMESPPPMRNRVILYRLIKISIPITLGAVVLQLAALIDMITIMNRLSGLPQEVLISQYGKFLTANESPHEFLYGCFTSIVTLFNLVPAFTNMFGKSALPNVTAAWTERERKKLEINVESVIRVTTMVAAPISFGLAFLSEPILKLVYKNLPGAISVGTPLLTVLGIASLFLAMVTPLNAIYQGIGRMDLPVKFLLVGASLKFILNFILIGIPSINIMGGSISTIVCYMTIATLSITTLRKKLSVPINFVGVLAKPVISGLICGISAGLCNFLLTKLVEHSIITVVSIGVGAIFYVISLGVMKVISADDVMMLPKGKKILCMLKKIHMVH